MKKREIPGVARPQTEAKAAKPKPVAKIVARSTLALSAQWLALSVLTAIFVVVLLYLLTVMGPAQSRTEQYTQTLLGNVADRLALQVSFIRGRVQQLAQHPDIPAALEAEDPTVLPSLERQLSAQLPESIGVRILPQAWHQMDMAGALPVSNVTLDLLRQTREGKTVPPEVIMAGNAREHILLIEPVKQGGKDIGYVLAGMKPELMRSALQGTAGSPGYLELNQVFGEAAQVVAKRGDESLKFGEAPYQVKVGESAWTLFYWPTAEEAASNGTIMATFWGLSALLIVGVGLLAFLIIRSIDRAAHQDASVLLRQLLASAEGKNNFDAAQYGLTVFKDIALTLARQEWSVRRAPAAPEPTETAAAPERKNLPAKEAPAARLAAPEAGRVRLSPEMFRAYDIRGVVGEQLNEEVVRQIGRAIGSEAFERGEQKVIVARDGRLSGPDLLEALKRGLLESGRDVIDLGAVPTPLLYFATHYLSSRSGVMLTGSHNPSNYNGLKIVLAGDTLSGDDIQRLRERIETGNLLSGRGSLERMSIAEDYMAQITSDVALAQPLKIVIDCGNGIAGAVAPDLYRALGCEVIELYCDVDGNFPNHHPDPSKPKNLEKLIETVKAEQADVGLAFDGDGDRLGVVDSNGKIIWPDRQLMLYAMDVLSRHPGTDIIYDVKCSRHLARVISGHGGRPLMWRTGHSLIKGKMRETGALLAGEQSGHIFFKERWYGFDDAIYTGCRLLEILAADFRKSADIFKSLPEGVTTPELNMAISDQRKFAFVDKLAQEGDFAGGQVNTIDGVRVDFADGWGLVRASNTTPALVLRFEADNETALKRIQELFRGQLLMVDPQAQLPF
ncbi:phosphomannomutase/phosphoglucomutase [Permianibacter aggregans]|uniref:phosphomannomutase n=1 Tax=Permianibacter aggregans TaxID=1510150 RepID=A0A4R6UU76_9GAMM|nr:phosphomannomutase/phosphoglucomutase [Permianibacter aggregans]TDQ49439.1 phosphomannomutase [Permianibacter aggregans]